MSIPDDAVLKASSEAVHDLELALTEAKNEEIRRGAQLKTRKRDAEVIGSFLKSNPDDRDARAGASLAARAVQTAEAELDRARATYAQAVLATTQAKERQVMLSAIRAADRYLSEQGGQR